MNRYTEVSKYLDENDIVSDQLERGWAPIYDVLTTEVKDEVKHACEIGIGFGNSLVIWRHVFGEDAHILGLDVGTPHEEINAQAGCVEMQYKNQLEGIKTIAYNDLNVTKNIQFGWNKGGYDQEVVDQAKRAYGEFQWVVNDGKQRGENWTWMEPWKEILTDGGIIFQEKIGREVEGISAHNVVSAIESGWLVYDCRKFAEIHDEAWKGTGMQWDNSARLHGECFMGIWSHDQAYIKSKLAHLEEFRVTDMEYLVRTTPEKYLV